MTPVPLLPSETFWTLLHNRAHWEFELFLMFLFDIIIGGIFWRFIKKHWKHHIDRDNMESGKTSNLILSQYGIREEDVMEWTLTDRTLTVVFRNKEVSMH